MNGRSTDEQGVEVSPGSGGLLVIDRPWPAMARTVWVDPTRYRDAYWSRYAAQGWFLAGDGAWTDVDGDLWLLGRVDDVINVSGHRLSTIEVESALVAHPEVGEAGVAGMVDVTRGQAIIAFVIPARPRAEVDDAAGWAAHADELSATLRAHVAHQIGPIARPSDVIVVPDLPKTGPARS